ncbi:MAG: hypothetical protein Q8R57_01940 [Bacteroidota bacterium]|nr:hypothetical protein [Bacteroidota bacterium]
MFDFGQLLVEAEENEELWFRAEMTHRQFASLSHKLVTADIENEIVNLDFFINRLEKAKNLKLEEVEKWLKNSWNTENVLIQNKSIIENTGQSFAMQWAFPQAYYSTFGSLLAHFKALGYTQESHTAVMKNFAVLVEQNKLPTSVCFYCTGGKNNIGYINIAKPNDVASMDFDIDNIKTIDNHICQFLKSTREIKLDEKAIDLKLKNKPGQKRKNLNSAKWQRVSEAIGHTTIMDLLYRKRIKANYQDIETFSSAQFKGLEVLTNLSLVVGRLNLINETYIAKAVGLDAYYSMLNRHLKNVKNETVEARFETIKSLVSAT